MFNPTLKGLDLIWDEHFATSIGSGRSINILEYAVEACSVFTIGLQLDFYLLNQSFCIPRSSCWTFHLMFLNAVWADNDAGMC